MAGVRQRKNETREDFLERRAQWWADKRTRERAEREARMEEYRARHDARREAEARGEHYTPPPTPTMHREVWESWGEFIEHATTEPGSGWLQSHTSSNAWAGASWEESLELVRHGYTAALPEVDRFAQSVADQVIDSRFADSMEWTRDVTGQVVDVAAYLMGEPENMIEAVPVPATKVGPLVRLIVPITAHAAVDEAIIRKRGAAVVALVTVLIRAGHTLEIWAGVSTRANGQRHSSAVKVQDSRDPIDMGRIMYALGHPAMLRRTMFGQMEHYPRNVRSTFNVTASGGYGMPDGAQAGDVPDVAGKTVVLPDLGSGARWEERDAVEWIKSTLDGLAD